MSLYNVDSLYTRITIIYNVFILYHKFEHSSLKILNITIEYVKNIKLKI